MSFPTENYVPQRIIANVRIVNPGIDNDVFVRVEPTILASDGAVLVAAVKAGVAAIKAELEAQIPGGTAQASIHYEGNQFEIL